MSITQQVILFTMYVVVGLILGRFAVSEEKDCSAKTATTVLFVVLWPVILAWVYLAQAVSALWHFACNIVDKCIGAK